MNVVLILICIGLVGMILFLIHHRPSTSTSPKPSTAPSPQPAPSPKPSPTPGPQPPPAPGPEPPPAPGPEPPPAPGPEPPSIPGEVPSQFRITPGCLWTKTPRAPPFDQFNDVAGWKTQYLARISYDQAVDVTINGKPADSPLTVWGPGRYSSLVVMQYGNNSVTLGTYSFNVLIPPLDTDMSQASGKHIMHWGDPSISCFSGSWGMKGAMIEFEQQWDKFGAATTAITFGGDQFYDSSMNASHIFYEQMHDFVKNRASQGVPYLNSRLMLTAIGNHDYDTGGNPPGCPACYAPTAFMNFYGQDCYSSAPPQCSGPDCWESTFGVYVIGSIGFIIWNDMYVPSNVLGLDKSTTAASILNKFDNLKKVWYISHWDGKNLGAAEAGPVNAMYFKGFASNIDYKYVVNHTHLNQHQGGGNFLLGGGGFSGGVRTGQCDNPTTCSASLLFSDAGENGAIPGGAFVSKLAGPSTSYKHEFSYATSTSRTAELSPALTSKSALSAELGDEYCPTNHAYIVAYNFHHDLAQPMKYPGFDPYMYPPNEPEPTPDGETSYYAPLSQSQCLQMMKSCNSDDEGSCKMEWNDFKHHFDVLPSSTDPNKYWLSCDSLVREGFICPARQDQPVGHFQTDRWNIAPKLGQGLPAYVKGCYEKGDDMDEYN